VRFASRSAVGCGGGVECLIQRHSNLSYPPAGEIFQEQLTFLATNPTYNMADHLRVLDTTAEKAGLKSQWQALLRTKSQQAEMEEQVSACCCVFAFHSHRRDCGVRACVARASVCGQRGLKRLNRVLTSAPSSLW